MLCLFFFFFNQKTAYEMRISDWSSDVCSSDLTRDRCTRHRHRPTKPLPLHPRPRRSRRPRRPQSRLNRLEPPRRGPTTPSIRIKTMTVAPHFQFLNGSLHAERVPLNDLARDFGTPLYEIGRAQCREKVCQ